MQFYQLWLTLDLHFPLQDSKCEIFSLSEDLSPACSIPVSNVGTIVLGTPIGDHSFV